MRSVDVVVIGAGAIGSAAAWWLAREGRDVVVLEQFGQGHARGSSHGGTRIFRLTYPDPGYVTMARSALELWRQLEADLGHMLLKRTSAVDHGEPATIRALAEAMDIAGEPYEMLSPEAAAERWPGMRFQGSVLRHADGGRCSADRTVRALQDGLVGMGAELRFTVGTASLVQITDGGVCVRATDTEQEWRAAVAVVAAGPWTRHVLQAAGLGDRIPPLRVVQDQVQYFLPRRPHLADSWPSFVHHRDVWHYGLWAPGEGVKVACGAAGVEVDPDDRPPQDLARERAVVGYVDKWLPGLDPTPRHRVTCLSTITPSRDFIIERVGPVVIGSACSGHGFKFTPLTGRRLADLVMARLRPKGTASGAAPGATVGA